MSVSVMLQRGMGDLSGCPLGSTPSRMARAISASVHAGIVAVPSERAVVSVEYLMSGMSTYPNIVPTRPPRPSSPWQLTQATLPIMPSTMNPPPAVVRVIGPTASDPV